VFPFRDDQQPAVCLVAGCAPGAFVGSTSDLPAIRMAGRSRFETGTPILGVGGPLSRTYSRGRFEPKSHDSAVKGHRAREPYPPDALFAHTAIVILNVGAD